MSVNLKTLTSVENEYLSKSGKKRRQKTLTDETNFPIFNANTNTNTNTNIITNTYANINEEKEQQKTNENIKEETEKTENEEQKIKQGEKRNFSDAYNIHLNFVYVNQRQQKQENEKVTEKEKETETEKETEQKQEQQKKEEEEQRQQEQEQQQLNNETQIENESDEDYDELEVIRQLSSIKIESDEDEEEKEEEEEEEEAYEKINKDKENNSSKNDKEIKIYNKNEPINAKIKTKKTNTNTNTNTKTNTKTKTKKKVKEPAPYLLDDAEIECVEDAVIYDESKDTEFPELQKLFVEYNETYFYGKLSSVEVKWSNKMKLCAGICVYKRSGYCCIRLSLPLLKLRKIKEYRETLLHEMIHAFLFLTRKNSSHDGHGPEFKKHMYRINKATGLSISIYHSFHDEVNFYRNHVWRCTGPCRKYPPHFGYIKRSMNRPPGPKEKWWRRHSLYCNGHFIKVNSGENENNETKELKPGDMYKDGKPVFNIKELTINTKPNLKTKNTKTNKKKQPLKTSELLQDAIIILDSKDLLKKKVSFEETDIVNLIKTLFNDTKNKVTTVPDRTIDYKTPFEDKNYFEIDSD